MYFNTLTILSFTILLVAITEALDIPATIKTIYEKHNCLRKPHGAGPLSVDKALEAQAQAYASKLAKDDKGLKHSKSNGKYGENLAWGSNENSAVDSPKYWYDEIKFYNFKKQGFGMKTGHFTQVVWKGSKSVGCGIAQSSKGTYTVCQYKPAGNFRGAFEKNVSPSTSGEPSC